MCAFVCVSACVCVYVCACGCVSVCVCVCVGVCTRVCVSLSILRVCVLFAYVLFVAYCLVILSVLCDKTNFSFEK